MSSSTRAWAWPDCTAHVLRLFGGEPLVVLAHVHLHGRGPGGRRRRAPHGHIDGG